MIISDRHTAIMHICEYIRLSLEAGYDYVPNDNKGNTIRVRNIINEKLNHLLERCEQTNNGAIYHEDGGERHV